MVFLDQNIKSILNKKCGRGSYIISTHFRKIQNTNLVNPSSGSRVADVQTDRQTDVRTKGQVCRYADRYDKLILIFRNFAKAHKR